MLLEFKDERTNVEYIIETGLDGKPVITRKNSLSIRGKSVYYFDKNELKESVICIEYSEDDTQLFVRLEGSVYGYDKVTEGEDLIKDIQLYIQDKRLPDRKIADTGSEFTEVPQLYVQKTGEDITYITTDLSNIPARDGAMIYKTTTGLFEKTVMTEADKKEYQRAGYKDHLHSA